MTGTRFTDERIISILSEYRSGLPIPELCDKHGMNRSTFYRWRLKFGSARWPEWYLFVGEAQSKAGCSSEAIKAYDKYYQNIDAAIDMQEVLLSQRRAIGNGCPAVIFVCMMKSGSEYIRDTVSSALNLPIMHPTVGDLPSDSIIPSAFELASGGGCVVRLHSSATCHNLDVFRSFNQERLIVHVRDPRQVLISWVHHMARIGVSEYLSSLHSYSFDIPSDFRNWPFEERLDWSISEFYQTQLEFLESWMGQDVKKVIPVVEFTNLDDLIADKAGYFRRFSQFYGINTSKVITRSIEHSPRRHRNYRRGDSSEWRVVLSTHQKRILSKITSPKLCKFYNFDLD